MIVFPQISPYIFQIEVPKIGTIGPTWYGLMYVVGFLLGYQWAKYRSKNLPSWTQQQVGDLLTYAIVGVIVGGRIGYVLFYNLDAFLDNPLYLFKITEGGMSFHGGLLGLFLPSSSLPENTTKAGWPSAISSLQYFPLASFLAALATLSMPSCGASPPMCLGG